MNPRNAINVLRDFESRLFDRLSTSPYINIKLTKKSHARKMRDKKMAKKKKEEKTKMNWEGLKQPVKSGVGFRVSPVMTTSIRLRVLNLLGIC